MKKNTFIILFSIGIITIVGLSFIKSTEVVVTPDEHAGLVHWYTFGEAIELQKKKPKMIMVDVYTSWCGPCKMMSANTFNHPVIASFLNEHFYPVKFDAETRDSVAFNNVVFKNQNPPGTNRPVHDFAISILDGKLSYPSIVFVDADIKRAQTIVGYHTANQFEPIINFLGTDKYKTVKYEEFEKTFVSQIK